MPLYQYKLVRIYKYYILTNVKALSGTVTIPLGDIDATNKVELISQTNEHRHDPDPNQVNARRELNQLKEKDITSQLSIQQIVASNVDGINQSTVSALPALSSMTRFVQRTSRDANTPLSNPNSLSLISLPIENTLSHRG
ncbi:hypothetical protein RF11_04094 [Thelohanellus kitauei]|uniref:Uncharacterized protein n=1 Tax=Thelohanellus kitauei TaxID=669202 RepID=A0A0C2MJW5_THEKT|nr:hypothetical protein RF11_04094 [Thelohanellus kitauei]